MWWRGMQIWWWNSSGSWQNSINNVMEFHRPKLPFVFGCFYFKMLTWIMLDTTSWVVECLQVLSIHFIYFSEVLITHNFVWKLQLPRWWEGSTFSERKPTAERKRTVLYQKIEQHVDSSCKQELTANKGTDGLGSLSLKCHLEKKKILNLDCMRTGVGDYWRFQDQYICFGKRKTSWCISFNCLSNCEIFLICSLYSWT